MSSGGQALQSSPLKTSARVQIWIVGIMLAVLGMWGMIGAWLSQTWEPALLSAAMLIAAVAVVSRRWWARYLVFALSAVYVGLCLWYASRSLLRGDFANKSVMYAFISLLPLDAFLTMACYWAYVAGLHMKRRNAS